MASNLRLGEFELTAAQMATIDALDGTDPRRIRLPPPPPLPCKDGDVHCAQWAEGGECERNPGFMHETCAGSCNTCGERKVEL